MKLDEETPLPPEKSCIAVCHTYSGLPSGITAKYAIAHPLWDGCASDPSLSKGQHNLRRDKKANALSLFSIDVTGVHAALKIERGKGEPECIDPQPDWIIL